jgi:hypothetical protein
MPEMTTSFRWTAEETKRAVLLVFSGLTALNVARRLIKDRRVGPGEALAGIAAIGLLWKEFSRRRAQVEVVAPAEPVQEFGAPAEPAGATTPTT